MPLESLTVEHLRNLSRCRLSFSGGVNLVAGPNASGKTSLLEAIALLAQGRSFRTSRIDLLIQHDAPGLTVVGKLRTARGLVTVGLAREDKKTRVRLNGEPLHRSTELIDLVPLHVITPESHMLLDQGPKMRRQFLDWGVFHVKHDYLETWRRYHRVLRQRNQSLRAGADQKSVQAWDVPLLAEADKLHQMRVDYLARLAPALQRYGLQLLDLEPAFAYQPGWSEDNGSLASQLRAALEADRERGFTRLGPHRADLSLRYEGKPVQSLFSRGQQKLLICAMFLAQCSVTPGQSIVLVDDLPAELDPQRRARLLQALASTGAQVFVTATEAQLIDLSAWAEKKVFHVEHGEFQEVV